MKIDLVKSAEKELLSLHTNLIKRIAAKIKSLEKNPFSSDTQKLAGNKGYRIRVGDYRIVYTVDTEKETITIVRIQHRREVYKNL